MTPPLDEQQREIYQGLSAIGPEIAAFYLDGVQIVESNFRTRSYLLGHIMREMDQGLREIYGNSQKTEELKNDIDDKELESLYTELEEFFKKTDYLQNPSHNDFKKNGHLASIIASFGYDIKHPFTIQYFKVTRWLHKYAHKRGAYHEPRIPNDIINLWNEFEDLLSILIGNYYSIADRLDTILLHENPTKPILSTLPNLFKNQSREIYFFNNLKHKGWLIPLSEAGYFNASNNPCPIESEETPGVYSFPLWSVLNYLLFVGRENLEKPRPAISKTLSQIVIDFYHYKDENGNRIDNYRTDYALFELIQTLPEEYIKDEHFLFIEAALKGQLGYHLSFGFTEFIERLITFENKKLLLRGIDLLLMIHVHEGSYETIHSIFGNDELLRILSDVKHKIIPVLDYELYLKIIDCINEVKKLELNDFHVISIPTIENHEQISFPEKYSCQLVFLLRDILESLDNQQVNEILKELLDSEEAILNRIAFHIIGVRYDEFKDLLWQIKINPLSLPETKHELYELFFRNSKYFSEEEIDQVINWINTDESSISDYGVNSNIFDKSNAYRKREWLNALVPSKSEKVEHLITELELINDAKLENPGFEVFCSSSFGYKSPLSIDDFNNLELKQIISSFKEFAKEDHSLMGPDIEGFIHEFSQAISNKPTKYNNNFSDIIDAPLELKYAWINGLEIAWRGKKTFDCGEVFATIKEIIENKNFEAIYNSNEKYSGYFISRLLSFISEGLQNNEHEFEFSLMPLIKDILFIILRNDLKPYFEYDELALTVLNSIKGKTYMSLLQFSLTLARYDNNETFRWDRDIKQLFSDEVNSGKKNPVFYYILGRYFHKIQHLDEVWVNDNFEKIFPIVADENWNASVSGYFSGKNAIPRKYYFKLFATNGHLEKGILATDLERESLKNLTQHICLAYLYGFKEAELESNIIHLLTKTVNEKIISRMIYIFRDSRVPTTSTATDSSKKVKMMWKKIYERAYKLENRQQDILFLSGCCTWLLNIDKIDDELLDIILNSVQYLNSQDRRNFYNALSKHIHATPQEVGTIMVELSKGDVFYNLSRDKIKDLVATLYKNGVKDKADRICNLHGEKGIHFLRELYAEYNT